MPRLYPCFGLLEHSNRFVAHCVCPVQIKHEGKLKMSVPVCRTARRRTQKKPLTFLLVCLSTVHHSSLCDHSHVHKVTINYHSID